MIIIFIPHKLIPIKTEKNINYSLDGYSSSPEYNIIHQKMKELKNKYNFRNK